MKIIPRLMVLLVLVVAMLGLFAERADAQIPAGDGTFYACVRMDRDSAEGKVARLVAANEPCRRNETRIHWSQTGPQGAPGTNGTNGAPGTNGMDGASVRMLGPISGHVGGCSNGGLRLLDEGTHTMFYLCDGKDGRDGRDGTDGADGVLTSLDSLAGLACTLPSGQTGTVSVSISAGGAIALQCALAAGKRMFVTSLAYTANFGGAAAADASCQSLASAAALGGTWKAWLSTSISSPSSSFTQASVPYQRVDGTLIANNWADLTDGTLANGVAMDEHGAMVNAEV